MGAKELVGKSGDIGDAYWKRTGKGRKRPWLRLQEEEQGSEWMVSAHVAQFKCVLGLLLGAGSERRKMIMGVEGAVVSKGQVGGDHVSRSLIEEGGTGEQ